MITKMAGAAVERTRHTQDSQGQILALPWAIFRQKSAKLVKVYPFRPVPQERYGPDESPASGFSVQALGFGV